ncbi:MAG: DUF433 domain-containing protein [Betaproteobacteria bacterium]|nr:DUF433 domain-containing protein [Betaproteobacteria bacterium]
MNAPPAFELRVLPVYALAEAAHYLRLPSSTVRAWCLGQRYHDAQGNPHRFAAVIEIADRKTKRLSFINLVELFVLAAIRRKHEVGLPQVRKAVAYLKRRFPSQHPLADHEFHTNRVDLFAEKFGELLNLSREGQVEMREMLLAHLRCVQRDSSGIPTKLFLIPRNPRLDVTKGLRGAVVIDPRFGFGRPVLDGTGIRTDVVIERFSAGEKLEALAEDYGRPKEDLEDVLRCELPLAA